MRDASDAHPESAVNFPRQATLTPACLESYAGVLKLITGLVTRTVRGNLSNPIIHMSRPRKLCFQCPIIMSYDSRRTAADSETFQTRQDIDDYGSGSLGGFYTFQPDLSLVPPALGPVIRVPAPRPAVPADV